MIELFAAFKKILVIQVLILIFGIYESVNSNIIEDLKKFQEILIKIQRQHISKPDDKKLIKSAIEGMLKSLDDPYSVYMEAKENEQFQDKIKSHFGGIGIQIGVYNDESAGDSYLQIIDLLPVKNCPAKIAGLLPKDIILKIDDTDAKNMPFDEAKDYLRGEVGSKVILTIRRLPGDNSETEPLTITVIRDEIELSQARHKILSDSIGYLRLDSFTELSAKDVKENLMILTDSGVSGIIFDLRSNPGGLLTAAVEISGYFISGQKQVVYTKDRNDKTISDYYTNGNPVCSLPLVLLVNELSASASEIVTGALKAHNRAVIIGKKTFGKGSVQQLFSFSDKSGLKLTNAYYYTPANICIHGKGIEPDVEAAYNGATKEDEQIEFAIKSLKAFNLLTRKNY
ncbi:MAG TPA: S41 family peptidase [bacterium]|nr:S41 family peptidase [bacterium]